MKIMKSTSVHRMRSKNRTNAVSLIFPQQFLLCLLMFSVMSFGCATTVNNDANGTYAQIVAGEPEIVILERELQKNGEWCSDFTLTTADVRYFFQHAREITGPEYAALDWYPCSIRGKIISNMRVYSWNINASGNGSVTHSCWLRPNSDPLSAGNRTHPTG